MAWADFPDARQSVGLLRRSLERGRLGHAYLFSGEASDTLEGVARELAATVNCTGTPVQVPGSLPATACGACSSCRRIQAGVHPDVQWLRAESKLRVIRVEQVRDLIQAVHLKPGEARYKVGIVTSADRLNPQAANAFLKTLEEPPEKSLLILLSTEPDRLLQTILSRCLRLTFPGEAPRPSDDEEWLRDITVESQKPSRSLLGRYRLLDLILKRLGALRTAAEETIDARSPAQQHREADSAVADQWEVENKAAAEGEYRRRRSQALGLLQTWMRDVWLITSGLPEDLAALPSLLDATRQVAARLDPVRAAANLQLLEETQRLLHTNVQEALTLEVALLRLHV